MTVKAEARYGMVQVGLHDGDWSWAHISREQAVALIGELAYAILQSGDYSDPKSQIFAEEIARVVSLHGDICNDEGRVL